MIYEQENMEEMLHRFFEGATSCEEERTLYRFFAGEDVPEHLRRYKPVFKYFETRLGEETAAGQVAGNGVKARPAAVWRWGRIGMAAAVAAGCIWMLFRGQADSFDPYEGSYIIRNGVRITDTKIIRRELEKTFDETLRREADMERLVNEERDPDRVFEQYRQSFEQQQNAILGRVTDPYAREEARKILTSEYNNNF
ncbi:MAG: hypothetical protein LBP64_02575 [Tannerella sp.]|jgi:hypothetical protein|nr:hypothetical protein [Tannerella sp.]